MDSEVFTPFGIAGPCPDCGCECLFESPPFDLCDCEVPNVSQCYGCDSFCASSAVDVEGCGDPECPMCYGCGTCGTPGCAYCE